MLKANIGNAMASRACQIGLIVGSFAGLAGVTSPAQAIADPCTTYLAICARKYAAGSEDYQQCVDTTTQIFCQDTPTPPPPGYTGCTYVNGVYTCFH